MNRFAGFVRSAALVAVVAVVVACLAPIAGACPYCGLSNRFGTEMLLAFGAFMAAPFVLAGFLARYIRRLHRGG